jgi:choline kinase
VRAIILAAGVGHRLAPLTDRRPKCLLPVGGRSLLERMLAALRAAGVAEAVVVVGHCQEQIRRLGARVGGLPIRYVENADYRRDSIRSLWAARDLLDADTLLMDADVLFPQALLRRLVECPAASALLIDPGFTDTGEEVKVFVRGGRVLALGKKVEPLPPHDLVGEGVGFLKCAAAHASLLRACMAEVLEDETRYHEYEDAIDLLVRRVPVGWADVGGLPWTEIDFVEDLRRAEAEVLPLILGAEGEA